MVGFIFGSKDKDKPWSYEELQKKREMADALMASNIRTPQNVGEGLHSIGKALMYRKLDKKAGAEESRMRDEFNAKWGALLGGSGFAAGGYGGGGGGSPSGTWTPDAPGPKPTETYLGKPDVAEGGLSFGLPKANTGVAGTPGGLDFGSAVMTPQEMLIEGSKRRGLDPIDVATAISYETGGKFDPMISGPTTQWGTHRGLIQFGEPQAKQHGVDFSNPDAAWRSQLDPDSGAIWSYLDGAGVKSGMGLPEIYSGINAGSVGRMNASDANNGGAPGTVADKVAGMAPHREKAAQFLGGTWLPNEGQNVTASSSGGSAPQGGPAPGGMDLAALVGLASDPMASPAQKAIIETLIQQQMQAADPLRQIEMERAQLELEALKNPKSKQPESLVERTALLEAAGVDPNSPEGQAYILTGKMPEAPEAGFVQMTPEEVQAAGLPPGAYQRSPKGEIKQIGGGGTNVTVNNGGSAVEPLGTDGQILVPDPTQPSGYRVEIAPGSKLDQERTADATKAQSREGLADTSSDTVVTSGKRAIDAASNRIVGGALGALASYNPGSMNAEVYRQTATLQAMAAAENINAMRQTSPTGGALGNTSDADLLLLKQKSGVLDPASPNYERDVKDYTRTLLRTIHGPEAGDAIFAQEFEGVAPPPPATAETGGKTRLRYNPATGEFE